MKTTWDYIYDLYDKCSSSQQHNYNDKKIAMICLMKAIGIDDQKLVQWQLIVILTFGKWTVNGFHGLFTSDGIKTFTSVTG